MRRHLSPVIVGLGAVAVLAASCGESTVTFTSLHLQITSDAPVGGQVLDRVRILFAQEGPDGLIRYPEVAADGDLKVSQDFDPVAHAVRVEVTHAGATFVQGEDVILHVSGRSQGGSVLTVFAGALDLGARVTVPVHLAAVDAECDADGDGFVTCEKPSCCPGGAGILADCDPAEAEANPWSEEDSCSQCGDGIDQDCDGFDAECTDEDGDGSPTCLDCDDGDPSVAPGKAELCDGKDNDCVGGVDDGFAGLGDPCGKGACAGGELICSFDGASVLCSTTGHGAEEETCFNGVDDDCNGVTDEGCVQDDVDGDGVSSTAGDCNDFDSGVYPAMGGAPGAPEPCCLLGPEGLTEAVQEACDRNCDEEIVTCKNDDLDGDGYPDPDLGIDCDDTDPMVYQGAPEKCGDGIDQDCFGGDQPCTAVIDKDKDGWSPPADCDDDDPDVNPEADEKCNQVDDDCDGITDEGNPDTSGGAICGTDVGQCVSGQLICAGSVGPDYGPGDVFCNDEPPVDELCDSKDNDCDASVDEDFSWDGQAIGASCDGTGACGVGIVVCDGGDSAVCDSMQLPWGAAGGPDVETCSGQDEDCDGTIDEALTNLADSDCDRWGICQDTGNVVQAECLVVTSEQPVGQWLCSYEFVADFEGPKETSCDLLDNDCDGLADEGFGVGSGCDGGDPDSCANGIVVCAMDDVAFPGKTTCDESDTANVAEVCDGQDNDCDNKVDEIFDVGDGCGTGQCAGGQKECTADHQSTQCSTMPAGGGQSFPGSQDVSSAEVCDDADNDCDGVTDEGLKSTVDAGCFTQGVCGLSGQTTALCTAGVYGCTYLSPLYQEGNELGHCDGSDNDCDGIADEEFTNGSVVYTEPDGTILSLGDPCGLGVCDGGWVACHGQGSTLVCTTYAPTSDVCNNLDDDCNGVTDDDYLLGGTVSYDGGAFAPDAGLQKGESCGVGYCQGGLVICDGANSTSLVCNTEGQIEPDLCNGFDEDCDGGIDEDFSATGNVAYGGGPFAPDAGKPKGATCGTGACVGGTVVCAGTDALTCSSLSSASGETCNGLDDDCDGVADEDFSWQGLEVGGSCDGTGACGNGTVQCQPVGGTVATCSTMSGGSEDQTQVETCNGLDDDCDGTTDENLSDVGDSDCLIEGVCDPAVVLAQCRVNPVPQDTFGWDCDYAGVASFEKSGEQTCDDLDNDCDGETDEAWSAGGDQAYDGGPFPGNAGLVKGQSCGTGACASGTVECAASGNSLTCSKLDLATLEACNGLDDDCDGQTDEDFLNGNVGYTDPKTGIGPLPLGANCGVGACAGGSVDCTLDGTGLVCSTEGNASDEICDDGDNDCDSEADEDFVPGGSVTWQGLYKGQSCGVGPCAGGSVVCAVDTTQLTCSSLVIAEEEICDAVDNDCNGQTDEDFKDGGTVTYDGGPYGPDQGKVLGDTCGIGVCSGGTVICDTADPAALACGTVVANATLEVCDVTLDNDCDGSVDEDFAAVIGQACGTGACAGGVIECSSGSTACSNQPQTTLDLTCDEVDDDCDGVTDEAFLSGGFFTYTDPQDGNSLKVKGEVCGTGACVGEVVCATDSTLGCDGPAAGATDDTCNGIDEDCSGQTDEDVAGLGDPCDGNDADLCANGQSECDVALQVLVCGDESIENITETCNNLDDDCDLLTDEAWPEAFVCDGDGDGCVLGTQECDGVALTCVETSCQDQGLTCNVQQQTCE